VSGVTFLESLARDIRYGIRVLLRNPVFTIITVLTLALGIGANTAIFSLIAGVLLRPLPYQNGERIVVVHQQSRLEPTGNMVFSAKEVFDYRDQSQTMDALVEHHSMNFILYGQQEPERVQTGVVSANFFDVLGVKPLLGRTFLPGDEQPGADAVLILSHKYWMQNQGGSPDVVGKVFQLNNRSHTVIGVLPPIPEYPSQSDVYMPTTQCPFRSAASFIQNRNERMMTVFGRLKPGVPVQQAQADVGRIAVNLQQAYPDSYPKNEGYTATVAPLQEELTRQARPTFPLLLATAGLVLLIASANVANLSLARLMRREQEMAVRVALGASRGRLVQQLLTESIVLALVGGGLGLLITRWAMPLLIIFAARFTNRTGEIGIDLPVLLFTLFVSIAAGLVCGLMPLFSSRLDSRWNLAATLKEDAGRSTSGGKNRVRSLLVVAQVAVAYTLLIGAGLMLRSLVKLHEVNPGFNPENVLVMRLSPSWSKYTGNRQLDDLFRSIMERVASQPGVQSSALASTYPLNPNGLTSGPKNIEFQTEEHPLGEGQLAAQVDPRAVSPEYFQTMSIPLMKGRIFTAADDRKAIPVAIINQSTARHHWGDSDPVGKRISLGDRKQLFTIVGVVGDVKQYGLDREPIDEVYFPLAQNPSANFLLVRTSSDPMSLARLMRDSVHQVDVDIAVDEVRTLEQVRDDSAATPRLTTCLFGLFAALALVITVAGITGVMALMVTQRRREIGLRMALGASRRRVLTMVMRQGMTLVLLGLIPGVAGALLLKGLIENLLFATLPTDPLTFATVSVVFMIVTATACLIPALRATRIDPLRSLRSD
jgi:predicted permease